MEGLVVPNVCKQHQQGRWMPSSSLRMECGEEKWQTFAQAFSKFPAPTEVFFYWIANGRSVSASGIVLHAVTVHCGTGERNGDALGMEAPGQMAGLERGFCMPALLWRT